MKILQSSSSYETSIDSDWNNFLMECGQQGQEKEPLYYENKNNKNKNNSTNANCSDHKCNHDNDNDVDYGSADHDASYHGNSHANNGEDNCDYIFDRDGTNCVNLHKGRETIDLDVNLSNPIEVPKCSSIYISTKTQISFLNTPIDIKKVFWDIPVMSYASQQTGIIKKQIKFSCTTKEELDEIEANTKKEIDKNENFIETQIIEHIDNPDGRIKFKDHRKISIGLSKKDILNCRSKKKRAFFNCFVLIIRVENENSPPNEKSFKEMHIKVFNTGKLEIPGIQHENSLQNVIDILIQTLKTNVGEHIKCKKDVCETVLMNSNFNCGFYIDRDKLYDILKYKYRINSNYDSCSYPGIQCKFFYYVGKDTSVTNTGQQPTANLNDYIEISFMIFRTGSVLIVGKCEDYVLHDIYKFLKEMFRVEFLHIYSHVIQPEDCIVKKHVPKLRSRTIINNL